jgi:hypothetical protein
MILIAEARPATADDEVAIRLADESCVYREEGARKPTFRLADLTEHKVRYQDIIAPDGAILTRLTKSRTAILQKLWSCERLEAAALVFWSRRTREGTRAVIKEPTGAGANKWQRDVLIKDGARLRGKVVSAANGGLDIYKGENITASRFTGDPVHRGLDIAQASAPSVWAYEDILPDVVYALPTIERVPVAAPFNPHKIAVLNTCNVFAPRSDLVNVPFDALLLSRVYSWFYVIAGRRSFLNKLRSHIYPSSVAALPWSEAIAARAGDLIMLRGTLLAACRRLFEQQSVLREAAEALGMQELRKLARTHTGATILRSDELSENDEFILAVGDIEESDGEWMLALGEEGQAATFNDGELAALARAGLILRNGDLVKWGTILRTLIPVDQAMADKLQIFRDSFDPTVLEEAVEKEVDAIDGIVGPALGLTMEEVASIQREMAMDPFMSRAVPRYPFFQPKQRGRRMNLERRDRYSGA